MSFLPEKRKNGIARRFPWRTLLLGLALGVIITLAVQSYTPYREPSVVYMNYADGDLERTATAYILGATLTAQSPLTDTAVNLVDPFSRTATALYEGQIFATPAPDNLDPIIQTATAYIVDATRTANP